jgi:hypothetical protein
MTLRMPANLSRISATITPWLFSAFKARGYTAMRCFKKAASGDHPEAAFFFVSPYG